MTKFQQMFYNIKTTTDYKVAGKDVDYKIFIDKDKAVLQFEETDSNTDLLNNLLFIPFPLVLDCIHHKKIVWTTLGYARAYKSTNNVIIKEYIKAFYNTGLKRCIRGWSLGSAMAKITERHLSLIGYPVDELTTFGDVKCWVNPFYKSKAADVHEFVTSNDAVTYCVPFFFRDKKSKVGPKFKLKELFKTEYYHTHYEDYDYGSYEND